MRFRNIEKGSCKTKEDGDDSRVLHAGQEKKGTSKFSNDVAKKRKLPHAFLLFSHFVLSIHLWQKIHKMVDAAERKLCRIFLLTDLMNSMLGRILKILQLTLRIDWLTNILVLSTYKYLKNTRSCLIYILDSSNSSSFTVWSSCWLWALEATELVSEQVTQMAIRLMNIPHQLELVL